MGEDSLELLTSGEVALTLGVGPSTVKRWTQSGELECVKTLGGHRRFARATVLAFARRNGLEKGGVAQPEHIDRWLTLLTNDVGAYEVQAALLTERAARGCWWRVAEAIGQVLEAAGRRWSEGRLTVVEEHLASEVLQRGLTMLVESLPIRDDAPRCLLATAENEDHTLGLSLLELCLREAGWLPRWAGRNTPTEELTRFVRAGGVRMVALSASATSTDLSLLARQVERLAPACQEHGVTLLLGGAGAWPEDPRYGFRLRGFGQLQALLQQIGA
ncbi:MAG: helix-turn-helix domain-containing protein [Myxococcota bacterium]|nr:helix-turn-helix domain-containing protein [Myxococcota bacterium]